MMILVDDVAARIDKPPSWYSPFLSEKMVKCGIGVMANFGHDGRAIWVLSRVSLLNQFGG